MSKLDDIFRLYVQGRDTISDDFLTEEQAKQELKALMLELIGDDEPLQDSPNSMDNPGGTHDWLGRQRNDMRAELRKKVEAL